MEEPSYKIPDDEKGQLITFQVSINTVARCSGRLSRTRTFLEYDEISKFNALVGLYAVG